jgi:uncharacterized RDD family membrane protein YckC
MNWYYAREGRQVGPVSEAELQAQVAAGVIRADTLVWREGMAAWQAYGSLAGATAAGPQQTCSQCGRAFATDELIRFGERWVCAACKPMFVQGLKEGAITPQQFRYGGFWIRLGARLIDFVILGVAGLLMQLPIMMMQLGSLGGPPSMRLFGLQMFAAALKLSIAIAYETVFVGKYGATPGKMACGLKVVSSDGSKVSYSRALARYFCTIISGLTLGIGYIMAAFDDEKRSLHDRICDTRVVKA